MKWSERLKSPGFALEVKKHGVTLDVTEELAAVMKARGLNKSRLAEKLGKSRAWLSKLFHGGRNVTIFTVVEIADALDHDVEVRIVPRRDTRRPAFSTEWPIGPSNVIPFTPPRRALDKVYAGQSAA